MPNPDARRVDAIKSELTTRTVAAPVAGRAPPIPHLSRLAIEAEAAAAAVEAKRVQVRLVIALQPSE